MRCVFAQRNQQYVREKAADQHNNEFVLRIALSHLKTLCEFRRQCDEKCAELTARKNAALKKAVWK